MRRQRINETGIYQVERGDEVIPVRRVKKVRQIQRVGKVQRVRVRKPKKIRMSGRR